MISPTTDDGQDGDPLHVAPLSIRCKNAKDGFTQPKYRVVRSNKTSQIVKATGGKITLLWSDFHSGPHTKENCSLLSHDIGAAVRSTVPMLASSFRVLPEHYRNVVKHYLLDYYIIPETEVNMWKYIKEKSQKRYSDWKHKCHKHFLKYGDPLPVEFLDRPEQWEYLVNGEFKDEGKQAIWKQKQINRTKSPCPINHHAGSRPLTYNAEEFAKKGHPAPYCAAAIEAYRQSKHGSEKADKLKRKVEEIIEERREDDPDKVAPLSFEEQHELVVYGFGERKGTEIRGFGGQLRRPSKIRVKTDISQQNEERFRNAEERAEKAEATAAEAIEKAKKLEEDGKKLEEEVQALRAMFQRYTADQQQTQTSGSM